MPKVACPKCGESGWLLIKRIKKKLYFYVDHYEGKGKHKTHYVGPVSRYPEFAELLDVELPTNNSKLSASYQQQLTARVNSKPITYEEFLELLETKVSEGDKDAMMVKKRLSKDKAIIVRVLKLLSDS